jgi:CubicO group peptidase (beta-lactamase class C family)
VVYKLKEANTLEPVAVRAYQKPPVYAGGGGGLASTVDDYLKFARMLMNKGELDGVRLLKPETVDLMTTNRLTDEQRAIPFMGIPFWAGQGFGLGLSVITDAEKQAWMGQGTNGAFSWPGAFGTWWRADPVRNMIMIYMIQNSMELGPEAASQLATGQRMAAAAALPAFQNLAYGAIQG